METIDRVMGAYLRIHQLSEAQCKFVRKELLKIIEELRSRRNERGNIEPPCDWPVQPRRKFVVL